MIDGISVATIGVLAEKMLLRSNKLTVLFVFISDVLLSLSPFKFMLLIISPMLLGIPTLTVPFSLLC